MASRARARKTTMSGNNVDCHRPNGNSRKRAFDSDAVAEHYDRRAAESSAERRQCRVLPLRNANNGAKARLIEDALRRAKYRIFQSDQQPPTEKQTLSPSCVNVISRPIYVLDLGCGKGGDLLKYARASEALGVDVVYYGVDLSGESIAEAQKRASETRAKHGRLVGIDYRQGDFCAAENAALDAAWLTADIVSVQFALHYAFASVSAVRRFFDNVGRALASDGELIGTLVDHASLVARLATALQQQKDKLVLAKKNSSKGSDDKEATTTCSFGNSLYNVAFDGDCTALVAKKDNDRSRAVVVGVRYRFALDGCIDDCDEFLVDRDYLRSMAAVVGLDLKIWLPIRYLYSAHDALVINNDGEQCEIADLYAAFVLARSSSALAAHA